MYCDIECLYFRDLCIFDFFLIFPFTHVLWFKVLELDKANETGQYGPLLCSTKTARQPAILHNAEDKHLFTTSLKGKWSQHNLIKFFRVSLERATDMTWWRNHHPWLSLAVPIDTPVPTKQSKSGGQTNKEAQKPCQENIRLS